MRNIGISSNQESTYSTTQKVGLPMSTRDAGLSWSRLDFKDVSKLSAP